MREVILGTAGHVDHGKTSLIKALTGTDTDRLKEEKERGITIELGFAFLDLPSGHRLGIVDVPGHERFVKNMVAGAAGIDMVAFVIAADEGIMPQTKEHFEICRLLGIEKGLLVITKKDLVEPDWLDLVKEEIRDFFADTFLAEAPMVTLSSTTGEGLDDVRLILDRLVSSWVLTESSGPFRLPVDRVFTMKGFGVVVTGASISGKIGVGDDILVYPKEIPAKIRGIQVHAADVREVEAGNRTAVNIQGIEKEIVSRGDVVATPGCMRPSYILDADFMYLSGNAKPLKNRTRVRVHLGTAEIMGRVVLLEDEDLKPGKQANVQLLLEEPVGVWPGDRYVVRSYSPVYTIGGGMVLDGSAVKRRRFKENNKAVFDLYHKGSMEDIVLLHLRESGFYGLTPGDLSIKTGLFGNSLKKALNVPVSSRKILVIDSEKQRMVSEEVYNDLKDQFIRILETFHRENPLKAGLSKEELRMRLHREMDQRLFQYLLNDLIKREAVVQEESVVRLAGHRVSLADDAKTVGNEMEALYRKAALMPPTIKEMMASFSSYPGSLVREVLDLLVREKKLLKISETLYFDAQTVTDLRMALTEHLKKEGEIDAQGVKSLTNVTRKFYIPLLEYFDREKLTIRVGDKRVLRERKS